MSFLIVAAFPSRLSRYRRSSSPVCSHASHRSTCATATRRAARESEAVGRPSRDARRRSTRVWAIRAPRGGWRLGRARPWTEFQERSRVNPSTNCVLPKDNSANLGEAKRSVAHGLSLPLWGRAIVQTSAYLTMAAGLDNAERLAIVDLIAADPRTGDLIRETGGLRKVRVPLEGRGKRGGWQAHHLFSRRRHAGVPHLLLRQERPDRSRRAAAQGGQGAHRRHPSAIQEQEQ
jgi:hypothetical protein